MPVWIHKRRVMRRYDQSARAYDAQYREEQDAKIKVLMQGLSLKQSSVVLDAGCGTGLLFKHLTERAESITGTDISKGLLRKARERAQPYCNTALIQADADNMPFLNDTFDAVFAITLLQNMPNPKATLIEFNRVAKSTALIVATGLRKRFSQEDFVNLLKQADLRVEALKLDEENREYVCICKKMQR